ncbi:DUF4189 domain-containing protein [Dyella tabacisoli]|uniref:DUF4189 domain-containing protein n=1 Tax=Dyella tabacisoli TaxID=2282381 RepID=A0A369USX3_9GAMM|nr:DUF4189 domain-containing protein [Dyella tabacisoli]
MKALVALALISCMYAPLAWSQCAPGVPSAGNPGCIPPDQPNSPYYQGSPAQQSAQQPAQPEPVWADRWGSIAVDGAPNGIGIGISVGKRNKQEAENIALAECQRKGGQACKVGITYANQCAAIAWGDTGYDTATASTLDHAKKAAVESCSSRGYGNCDVYYAECNFAERVR